MKILTVGELGRTAARWSAWVYMGEQQNDGIRGPSQSLVDHALTLTRERILKGEYAVGSRLRLQQLAEESGASLIPVREALRVLEAERLVEIIPNKGARVASLSVEDMRDLYAARIVLEPETLLRTRDIGHEEATSLRKMLDELSEAMGSGDNDLALRRHRDFHFALYDLAGSRWFTYLIDILWKHAERYQRLSIPLRHDRGHEEHGLVLESLIKGDREKAAEALREHLDTTAKLVEEGYRELVATNDSSNA